MNPLSATLVALSLLLKDLWADRLRSLLTLFTLGAMVVSYLILSAISATLDDFGQGIIALGRNLVMFSADIIDPMESTLTLTDLQAAAQAIQDEYGPQAVRQVSPIIFRHMKVGEWILQVAAISPEDKHTVYQIEMLQGQFPSGPSDVAISQTAYATALWKPGETLSIYGSDFQIVGVFQISGSQAASIIMNYETGQALFGLDDRFQIGVIQIDPRLDAEAARRVAESAPALGGQVAIYLEDQLNAQYHEHVQSLVDLINIFNLLALLAITFGAYHAASLTL
ncbi:MAG: ABC transporter permease, partial [Anaerolineales bacterium]|nr:ABC transporter permease [Anaerolineales bacterium]